MPLLAKGSLVSAVIALLAGFLGASLYSLVIRHVSAAASAPAEVRASRFVLVNSHGEVSAVLENDSFGFPHLRFFEIGRKLPKFQLNSGSLYFYSSDRRRPIIKMSVGMDAPVLTMGDQGPGERVYLGKVVTDYLSEKLPDTWGLFLSGPRQDVGASIVADRDDAGIVRGDVFARDGKGASWSAFPPK